MFLEADLAWRLGWPIGECAGAGGPRPFFFVRRPCLLHRARVCRAAGVPHRTAFVVELLLLRSGGIIRAVCLSWTKGSVSSSVSRSYAATISSPAAARQTRPAVCLVGS